MLRFQLALLLLTWMPLATYSQSCEEDLGNISIWHFVEPSAETPEIVLENFSSGVSFTLTNTSNEAAYLLFESEQAETVTNVAISIDGQEFSHPITMPTSIDDQVFPSPNNPNYFVLPGGAITIVCIPENTPIEEITLTIPFTFNAPCHQFSVGCESSELNSHSPAVLISNTPLLSGEILGQSLSFNQPTEGASYKIRMDEGDWIRVSAFASTELIRFQHNILTNGEGPLDHRVFLNCCPNKTTIDILAGKDNTLFSILPHSGLSSESPECFDSNIALDSLSFEFIRPNANCDDFESCGCRDDKAYNYSETATINGICQYRNPKSSLRFNQNHYIDRFGVVRDYNGTQHPGLPTNERFIGMGQEGPAYLTESGKLYWHDDLIATGISCFDATFNTVLAADSTGIIECHGDGWGILADYPTPNTGGIEVVEVQLTKEFYAAVATRGYALLANGEVLWWPASTMSIPNAIVPYATDSLHNIIDIHGGRSELFAIDKSGDLHTVISHNHVNGSRELLPDELRGNVSMINGNGHYHYSLLNPEGKQFNLSSCNWCSGATQWLDQRSFVHATGDDYDWNQGVFMDLEGVIRDETGAQLAVGSIVTDWAGSSIVSPAEAIQCHDSAACNYLDFSPCHYFNQENQRRFHSSVGHVGTIDTAGILTIWSGNTGEPVPIAVLESTPIQSFVLNQDLYSYGLIEYGCALDTTGTPITFLIRSSGGPNTQNAIPHHLEIPESLNGKMCTKLIATPGLIGVFTDNAELHVWGSDFNTRRGNRFEAVYTDVMNARIGNCHIAIEKNSGESLWVKKSPLCDDSSIQMIGSSKSNMKQWDWLQEYQRYGTALYHNGQVATIGKDDGFEAIRNQTGNEDFIQIESSYSGNHIYALNTYGQLYQGSTGNLINTALTPVVAASMSAFGYGWKLSNDGIVTKLMGSPGLDTLVSTVLCGCYDPIPAYGCPCAVDTDGDGLCEGFDLGPCDAAPIFSGMVISNLPTGPYFSDGTLTLEVNGGAPSFVILNGINGTPSDTLQIPSDDEIITGLAPGTYDVYIMDLDSCLGVASAPDGHTHGQPPVSYPLFVPYQLCCGSCGISDQDMDGICDDIDNCTDRLASNYSDPANSGCIIPGCTDQSAFNFNPNATTDDGSCTGPQ